MVDFHWNVYDPWTIVSVSDDGEFSGGGGTLQVGFIVSGKFQTSFQLPCQSSKSDGSSHVTFCCADVAHDRSSIPAKRRSCG